jgi:TolB-like protein/tRNA A-37 threonylcarbamoyl transferase component Bud32/Tfp pilus assembly protein PilF
MIGTELGRYRILEPLGEGGMGRIYLAEDPTLGRRVAIKVLPPETARDESFRNRLLHEARSASALNHPNILTVYDLGEQGGVLYVATELVDGTTLRQWAAARPACPPAEVLALVRQATRALAVAHAQGLVHRDLKPENLMVRRDGLLKILDFGLARSVSPMPDEATALRTAPGAILGTAPYMSPEQVLGQPAGPASDVFAMGTILYELLTGRHPFAAPSAVETMNRILHDVPEPPSRVVPGLPPAIDFVVAKALAREPARRYATAGDLDVDLESCAAALAAAGPRDAGPRAERPVVAASAPGAGAAGAPRAIAVLPFKNIGGSPDLDYLGIGLADALITRLSTSPDLVVRATSSIARYGKTPVDPRHVAQELEVSAVLDASFQRAGSRFRATARLIEEPGGRALWAGKIDLEFDDIFTVQDEVAGGIASALSARVRDFGRARHTPLPEAFESYLRAREPERTGTPEGLLKKIALLEKTVALDPDYADAWAYLAKVRGSMFDTGFDPDPAWVRRADDACRRALEIDPDHSYARYTKGTLDLVRGRKREAYHAFVRRHREHPNEFQPHHYLAYVLRLCNLVDRAVAAERRAMELDPSTPWPAWTIIRLLVESRRDAEAVPILERAQVRFAGMALNQDGDLLLLRNAGRFEEIVARVTGADRIREGSRARFELAYALLRLGRVDEARSLATSLAPYAAVDMDYAAYQAVLHGWLGERDAAFDDLARAAELGNDSVYLYEREDLFGPLYEDPRWAPFLAERRARAATYREELRWPIDALAAAGA